MFHDVVSASALDKAALVKEHVVDECVTEQQVKEDEVLQNVHMHSNRHLLILVADMEVDELSKSKDWGQNWYDKNSVELKMP